METWEHGNMMETWENWSVMEKNYMETWGHYNNVLQKKIKKLKTL